MSIKIDRISREIGKEISHILAEEVKDNDLKFITITDCNVTNDLSYARVYFTCLNDSKKEEIIKTINNAAGFIRKELTNRIDIRHIPELEFIYDDSIEYGKRIEEKIKEIHNGQ